MQRPRTPVLSKAEGRFMPVQVKARHDGWTPSRQRRFIEELAASRSISKACRAVGMSRDSAYKLRDRPGAEQFRLAWRQALEPDFAEQRRRSARGLRRPKRPGPPPKADKVNEMEESPNSRPRGESVSSALSTLQTLLDQLRAQEKAGPNHCEERQG